MPGSDESFLRFYESYRRAPTDEVNCTPRAPGDFRERVPRETLKGRYGVFHETFEMYLNRQWRAYTCPRVAVFTFGTFALMQHSFVAFQKTFPNLKAYDSIFKHPSYKMLAPIYTAFFALRPAFWTYMFYRMSTWQYQMIKRHWEGKDE